MSVEKERIDYLDIAKAITIFLVLMGHTGASTAMYLYRRIIYTFHMPLFLMVSGVVSERHRKGYSTETWRVFLKKNAFALIIPYFFWALLYSDFSFRNVGRILYASWFTIDAAGSVLALWYLISLFMARLGLEAVLSLSRITKTDRHLFAALFSPIPFAIGLLLPASGIGYPWELDASFLALGFLLLGYASKDLLKDFVGKSILSHILLFVTSAALFTAGILFRAEELPLVTVFKANVGNVFWFFYLALTGSATVIGFAMLLAKLFNEKVKPKWYRGILWMGRNTMGIFLLHKPFLPEVVMPALVRLGMDETSVITSVVGTLITLPYAILGTVLLKKYFPALLGIRSADHGMSLPQK